MEGLLILLAGLAAGSLHVFAGPDHLAAIAPLTSGVGDGRGWTLGLRWGLGHAAGAAIIAAAAFALRGIVPLERLSHWGERFVGVLLIGIGLWALRQAGRRYLHRHSHTHRPHEGHDAHEHIHLHDGGEAHEHAQAPVSHRHGHAALGVGLLHGAAGSHHIVGLLPALALPTTAQAVLYLAGFSLGTVAAMTAFAGLLGGIFARFHDNGSRVYQTVLGTTGIVAVAVGIFWLIG